MWSWLITILDFLGIPLTGRYVPWLAGRSASIPLSLHRVFLSIVRHHYTSLMRKRYGYLSGRGLVTIFMMLGVAGSMTAQPNCPGSLSPNALPGGDFGSGPPAIFPTNPGLAPGYVYQPNPPPNDGFYTIASTTNFGAGSYPCWLITGDNSSDPNGYMMIVNASNAPGIFFRQRVQVCENTTYIFQADILNLMRPACIAIDPDIDFLIDGNVLFQSGRIPKSQVWETFGFTFETGAGVTEIELSLRNNAPGGEGNDLALDNIGFFHCGPNVTISQSEVICEGGSLELESEVTDVEYDNISFQWQVSNDLGMTWVNIPGANTGSLTVPEHRNQAWYRLLVANGQSNLQFVNCRTTTDPFVPEVIAAPVGLEDYAICSGDTIFLYDTLVATAGSYEFLLKDDAGCDSLVVVDLSVLSVYNDTTQVSFICPGSEWEGTLIMSDTFIVREMLTVDGCDSLMTWDVRLFDIENAVISGPMSVCRGGEVELSALGGFENYEWSTGANTQTINVGSGSYSLSITDVNGCVTEFNHEVTELDLEAALEVTDEICPQSDDGIIEVLEVTGGAPPYNYSITGHTISEDGVRFEGLSPGVYELMIRDSLGCLVSIPVTVREAPNLTAEVQISGSAGATLGESITVDIQANFVIDSILWVSGGEISCFICPSTIWTPTLEGDLSWVVFSPEGCVVVGDTILVPDVSYDVYFPTAFSPDGDQINDLFRPYFSQVGVKVVYFQVFDRWGSLLFEQAEIDGQADNLGWDGRRLGNDMQPGLYIYSSSVLFPDSNEAKFAGSVLLIR